MPDAQRAEIAKLEALHAEHPQGRIFTHLAEAYRKAGELDRAQTVLREGIERHPDYSSAHVVLARVLMDMGESAEAESEFRRVLELDSHNLVALRSLGDLARGEGRTHDAIGYYEKLLDVEPADEDVRDLLEGLTRGDGGPSEPDRPPQTWDSAIASEAPTDVAPHAEVAPEPSESSEGPGGELAADPGDQGLATETIAQVYARQGLYDRAADVYRQLLNSRPDDDGIRTRLEEMEALAAAPAPGTEPGPDVQQDEAPADEIGWGQTMEEVGQQDADGDREPDWQTDASWQDAEEEADWQPEETAPWEEAPPDELASQEAAAEAPEESLEPAEPGELESQEVAPEDVEPVAGLAVPDYSAGAEVEPLEGLETDATDFRLGFDDEAVEGPRDEPGGDEAVEPIPGFETAVEEESADAETVESVWTGAAGAQDDTATPYAWAEPEPETDQSMPVGDYLRGLLGWNAEPAGEPEEPGEPVTIADAGPATEREPPVEAEPTPEPGPVAEAEPIAEPGPPAEPEPVEAGAPVDVEAGTDTSVEPEPPESAAEAPEPAPPAEPPAPEPTTPEEADEDDDDLDMFRSWLESLKE